MEKIQDSKLKCHDNFIYYDKREFVV